MTGGARYLLADVFTDRPFGGNQLAVFPEGGKVSPELMPVIARELNLSETVFVLPPDDPEHAARLRIFTPASELPFAGHPTVGTACVLVAEGMVVTRPDGTAGQEGAAGALGLTGPEGADFVLELGVGPVSVRVRGGGQTYHARFDVPRLPEMVPDPPATDELAKALGLGVDDLRVPGWKPEVWSCGVPFLVIPIRDRSALARARLDTSRWERSIAPTGVSHLYLLSPDPELAGSSLRARMFAPGLGITEDPATGSAASTLGGFLGVREPEPHGPFSWRIEQGFEMGRPSLIDLEIEKRDGAVALVRVGGDCVLMGEGRLDID
ncbi:MAG: PhzF family phenazine biosynthesis protein [Gemmatimonadota bacterium]